MKQFLVSICLVLLLSVIALWYFGCFTETAMHPHRDLRPKSADTESTWEHSHPDASNEGTLPLSEQVDSDHNFSDEELKAKEADLDKAAERVLAEAEKAKMVAARAIDKAEASIAAATRRLVEHLNRLSPEEQRVLLNEHRNRLYSHKRLNTDPDYADRRWNLKLKRLAEQGYNIPPEWTELKLQGEEK